MHKRDAERGLANDRACPRPPSLSHLEASRAGAGYCGGCARGNAPTNQKARVVMGNKFIEKLKAKRAEKLVDVHLNAYSSLEEMPPDNAAWVNKLMREMREDAFKKQGEAAFYC